MFVFNIILRWLTPLTPFQLLLTAPGWVFGSWADATANDVNGHDYLYQVYQQAKPDFTGKITVPVL